MMQKCDEVRCRPEAVVHNRSYTGKMISYTRRNAAKATSTHLVVLALLMGLLACGHALVRTENQRYALFLGMCSESMAPKGPCLAKVETRTNWLWHLYYAFQN